MTLTLNLVKIISSLSLDVLLLALAYYMWRRAGE